MPQKNNSTEFYIVLLDTNKNDGIDLYSGKFQAKENKVKSGNKKLVKI